MHTQLHLLDLAAVQWKIVEEAIDAVEECILLNGVLVIRSLWSWFLVILLEELVLAVHRG